MLCIFSLLKNVAFKATTICNNHVMRQIHLSAVCDAARKGTREKARKKKVKVEIKKIGFIPHNLRNKDKHLSKISKHIDDSWKAIPKDNCYVGKYYKWRVYSVAEAIACHRETHHPTMYNLPNAQLNAVVELNMQGEKITRFVDNFQRMALIPHKFDHGEERKILVFTKTEDSITAAKDAGATLAGGVELIKEVQNGKVLLSDYQFIVAHPIILPELVSLRGLLKRKFPNPKNGTLGTELTEIIHRFCNGISYSAMKDEYQQNYAKITATFGYLNMDTKQLEDNLQYLLKDINSVRPKRAGKFITRVLLTSPPSGETLKIDPFIYVPEENMKVGKSKSIEEIEKDDDDEQEKEKTEAVN